MCFGFGDELPKDRCSNRPPQLRTAPNQHDCGCLGCLLRLLWRGTLAKPSPNSHTHSLFRSSSTNGTRTATVTSPVHRAILERPDLSRPWRSSFSRSATGCAYGLHGPVDSYIHTKRAPASANFVCSSSTLTFQQNGAVTTRRLFFETLSSPRIASAARNLTSICNDTWTESPVSTRHEF